ncbi:MAG: EAL domain-containing protein [Pedobacter sp.]
MKVRSVSVRNIKFSLKTKMAVAVTLLVAILLATTGVIFSQFFRKELENSISSQSFSLISSLAREIDGKLRATREHLLGIAQRVTPEVLSDPANVKDFLNQQTDNKILFDNGIFLFSPSFVILGSSPNDPYSCSPDCPFEKYLKKTLQARAPQISEPFFSTQENRRPVVMFTAPVFGKDDQIVAILAGNIDLLNNNFLGHLADVRLGKNGYLYLYNQERTLIVHPDRRRILKQDVPLGVNKMFDRALGGFEGTGETVTSRGLHALSSFKKLPTTGWILAANFPMVEAYAPVGEARRNFLFALVVMLFVSAVTTWCLMWWLTAPLGDLTRKILTYPGLESSSSIQISTRDEIGALAATFNQMLSGLSAKTRALKEQIHFLQVLIDVMPNPVFFKDAQGRYLGCNKAFERYIGISKDELIGKTVFDIAPAHLAEVYHRADTDLLAMGAGKTQVYENSLLWADGTLHQVIFYKANFSDPDGNLSGLVGTILDISDRKHAEIELEEQKRFSEEILQNAAAAAFVLDANHNVIVWNRACEELTGVRSEGLLGTDGHWRAFYDHKRPCLADFVIDGNLKELPDFYTNINQSSLVPDGLVAEGWSEFSGNRRYVIFNAAPIRNAEGELVAVIQTLDDITDRKIAEEHLSGSLSLLEATLESTGDGILVVSLEGEIVTSNKQFSEMWQVPEDLINKGDNQAVLSSVADKLDEPETFLEIVRDLYAHPERQSWDVLRFKDGKFFECLTMPQKLDDQIVGRVWSFRDITSQRQMLDQLNKLSLATEQSPNSVVITDPAGNIEYVNSMFTKMSGYASEEVLGKNPRFLKGGTFPDEYYRTLWETITAGREWRGEFHNKRKNGEFFWESALISPLKNANGVITNFVAVKQDITKKKLTEQRQLLTGQVLEILALPSKKTDKIRDILQLIKDFTGVEGAALRLVQENDFVYENTLGFEELYTSDPCHLSIGENCQTSLAQTMCGKVFLGLGCEGSGDTFSLGGSFWTNSGLESGAFLCPLNHCCHAGVQSMAVIPLRFGGKPFGVLQLIDRQSGKFNLSGIKFLETLTSTISIALEHRKAEKSLQEKESHLNFLASYDSLTLLPNRALFCDRLQHILAIAKRSGQKVALLLLDLDRFKTINDSLGHDIGDHILCQVAARIKSQIRESDTLSRFGGDEFAVILEDVDEPQNALITGQKILEHLSEALTFEGHQLYLTASIGISIYPNDGDNLDTLIKYAEVAMYRAKELGRNNCQFYRPEMNVRSRELLFLEGALRQALTQEEFVLHYQPQVDLATGLVVGAEALVRWCHPSLGLVPPGDFIPLAEETGLIVPLGDWVLRTACHQIKLWNSVGETPMRVSVNISARQFNEPNFIDKVDQLLQDTQINPKYLEMEITESVIMGDVEESIMTLTDLKVRGINLAIDDFGTGYSSLSYLQKFPISHLKIDRSFVRDVCSNEQSAEIASSIIALAQNMHLKVIAEGVETEEQMEFLRSKGCDEVQGYLFSRPVPPEEMEKSFQQILSITTLTEDA